MKYPEWDTAVEVRPIYTYEDLTDKDQVLARLGSVPLVRLRETIRLLNIRQNMVRLRSQSA